MDYKKVSIIIPVYNEAKTVEALINLVRFAGVAGLQKEIIVVDDCSIDGTMDVLQKFPEIKIFRHEMNKGKGAAIHTGFEHATGDIAVIQDADLEYDPQEIENVIKPFLTQDASVVYGSRYLNPSEGLGYWHSFFNKFFTRFGNLLTGLNITDLMTCYKALNRKALAAVVDKLKSERFGFEPEITARLAKAGFKIIEVPVSYKPRTAAQGKHMNFKGQIESLIALIRYTLFD